MYSFLWMMRIYCRCNFVISTQVEYQNHRIIRYWFLIYQLLIVILLQTSHFTTFLQGMKIATIMQLIFIDLLKRIHHLNLSRQIYNPKGKIGCQKYVNVLLFFCTVHGFCLTLFVMSYCSIDNIIWVDCIVCGGITL